MRACSEPTTGIYKLSVEARDYSIVNKSTAEKLVIARQRAAVATAFLLPWSTSGLAIAMGLFLLLTIPTIRKADLFAVIRSPAGVTPVLLFLLLLIGMLWSSDPWGPGGLSHYFKLLLIPIVMATAFTPRDAAQIGLGFLGGCFLVLLLSLLSFYVELPWKHYAPGIPFKENAVQSGNFALCAFGLAICAVRFGGAGQWRLSVAAAMLGMGFFINVFTIYISKTGALMVVALMGLLLINLGGWKRSLLTVVAAIIIAVGALHYSPEAQRRLAEISTDINANVASGGGEATAATISTASRVDFWTKALEFIKAAPILGHGTGSTKRMYQSLEASRPSPYGEAVPDPHNQFLAIAIQVGLLGGALLVAMWLSHALVLRGTSVACVLGQAVILQNVLGSLVNSHISTVTQGSLYCLAVGLLAGLVLRGRTANVQAV